MKSMTLFMALVPMTLVWMMRPTWAHEDQVCMECPYRGHCSGSAASYCTRFVTYPLTKLQVTVNCSHPDVSRITSPAMSSLTLDQNSTTCNGFNVVHEYSCLTAFPDNLCEYGATRAIGMSNNKLSRFPDLQCLSHLGKLDLTHNKLTAVPHHAFKGLKYIREIFLDHNEISYIDPLAFEEEVPELSIFSVSYNRLLTTEAWAFSMHHPFCEFDFSHNQIHHFTNLGHWKFNTSNSVVYGPGYVDFSYNRFESGISVEFPQFGIHNVLQLAKFIRWGFDLRYNPFRCDCTLYSATKWAKHLAKFIWRDYFNVTCFNPPNLRGLPMIDLPLEAFVCNVTADCPPRCSCQNQPAKKALSVDCDNVGLTSLPDALPQGDQLVVHMANNSVHTLPPRHYLTRIKSIDLRGSGLKTIPKDTPHLLKDARLVDLRDNELRGLPATFQVLDPEVVRLDLHTLECSCDLDWMPSWLQDSKNLRGITCKKEDGERVMLTNATKHDLCDEKMTTPHTSYKISLIVVLSTLAVVTSLLLALRYELMVMGQILRARFTQWKKRQSPALVSTRQFDVFISVNVNSSSDTEWVNDVLIPALNLRGLSCYLPPRDCPVGSVEMDELTKRVQDSATALVVLSPDYTRSPDCLFQFKQAYSHMITLRQGSLLLIQRDGQMSRRSVAEHRLRAMLTLRMFHSAELYQLHKALDAMGLQQESEV